MTLRVTLWLPRNVWFIGGEKIIIQISSNTPLFCDPLNTCVVIILGLSPSYPSHSYTLWFDRVLQGFKGKLMLLHLHVFLFVLFLIAGIY